MADGMGRRGLEVASAACPPGSGPPGENVEPSVEFVSLRLTQSTLGAAAAVGPTLPPRKPFTRPGLLPRPNCAPRGYPSATRFKYGTRNFRNWFLFGAALFGSLCA